MIKLLLKSMDKSVEFNSLLKEIQFIFLIAEETLLDTNLNQIIEKNLRGMKLELIKLLLPCPALFPKFLSNKDRKLRKEMPFSPWKP